MHKPSFGSDTNKRHTLLIWDAEESPPNGNWTTVLWNSFGKVDDPDVISIPTLIEEQSDILKARYLAWIYELGEVRINGKRLVDHLELRPGLSYWWMSSLAQKSNPSGMSQIDNAIKALALEGLVSKRKPQSIVLVSNNDGLASTLQSFCRDTGFRFERNSVNSSGKAEPASRLLYNLLPSPLQALIYFFWYLSRSVPLLCTKHEANSALNGEIIFIDNLVHLDEKASATGKFISNYWTSLVEKLVQLNVKSNWLHNYFYQESIPTFVRAQQLIGRFNQYSNKIQTHTLIEANLSLSVFIKALKDYFRIYRASSNFSIARLKLRPSGSALDLSPMLKHEWMSSLKGQIAIVNCLCVSLYEKTFSEIPYQKTGVYIQENQPWEYALIYAWKAAGHGTIIGAPHTTVRYGDLRYFYDRRSYECAAKNALPVPDKVAINGPVAKKLYLEWGYPEEQVVEVEALRFLHLSSNFSARKKIISNGGGLHVLVCGDFLATTNYKMLAWLEIAAKFLPPKTHFVFKPHPAYTIKLDAFPSLALEVTESPLPELFMDCDVVFSSNITSAAVDAYYSGIPVVQMLEGTAFNMSPLRNLKGVKYVTNPKELVEALQNVGKHGEAVNHYFFLDKKLPRWQKLLGQASELGDSD